MENANLPWLSLKREYIDENFERLLLYLRDAATERDSTYSQTLELLKQRVLLLIDELAGRTLWQDEELTTSREFNIRLLAAWLLADEEGHESHVVFIAMLGELRRESSLYSLELMRLATECLRYERVRKGGYTWDDLINFRKELFAFRVINNCKMEQQRDTDYCWRGFGSIKSTPSRLYFLPDLRERSAGMLSDLPVGIDTDFGIRVMTPGMERLKHSLQSDIRHIASFTRAFVTEQRSMRVSQPSALELKNYKNGAEVLVRVVKIQQETIVLETTDPEYYKLQGPLKSKFPTAVLYYKTNKFSRWFMEGYLFPANVRLTTGKPTFSIDDTLVDFIVEDCKNHDLNVECLAKLIFENNFEQIWLNENGIPVYTRRNENYHVGSYAYVIAETCYTGDHRGKIFGQLTGPADDGEVFIEDEVRRNCIQRFCYDPYSAADKNPLTPLVIKLLIRHIFAHQKHQKTSVQRLQTLAVARILAEMLGDDCASEYIDQTSAYLSAIALFAQDENVSQVQIATPEYSGASTSALLHLSVVKLLQQWGGQDGAQGVLVDTMQTFSQSQPVLARIAQIIQGANVMHELMPDQPLSPLRREVIQTLQIGTGEMCDFGTERGIYMGVENATTEFKKSVVFLSDQIGVPNEEKQFLNVLRGVCAMLNSMTGGTVYIGVSDSGYVTGIQNDLDQLNITNPDTYLRLHIQDPAIHLLGQDVVAHLHFELMHDQQVVAIHVDPYPYGIVELDGKAYVRLNAESREMSETVRQQLLNKKVFTNQERAASLAQIQLGIRQHQVVVLHQYASSSSDTIADRTVEAYSVYPETDTVLCLDLEDASLPCRCFHLSRIGYVEVTDKPWRYKPRHKSIKVDAFHQSGDKKTHCLLQLDMTARNLLLEEYPKAKEDLTKVEGQHQWILDTEVFQIEGIGRFVIGLADHITLLDAPELKQYVRQFTREHLSGE